MKVLERIAECDDGKSRRRDLYRILGVTMHQFDFETLDVEGSVVGIAEWYRKHPKHTGGQMPYTFGVYGNGEIEQALPLREMGPHAMRWSSPTIGIVWLGEFSKEHPSAAAWHSAAELVADICGALELNPRGTINALPFSGHLVVAGHTERPGSTMDAGKVCPGRAVSMSAFRELVIQYQQSGAIQRLASAGVIS